MLIGWNTAPLAFHLASVRYRALLPVLCLHERGIQARIFSTGSLQNLDNLDVLVIVKSYGTDDLYLASAASHRGIPIVIDLCDNIFIESYGKKRGVGFSKPALHFDKIANLASTVVVTTSPLADIVRSRVGAQCSVLVIPDGIETPADVRRMATLLAAADLAQRHDAVEDSRQRLASLQRKVSMLRSAEMVPLLVHLARSAIRFTPARIRRLWLKKPPPVHPLASAPPLAIPVSSDGVDTLGGPRPRSIIWFGHHGAGYVKFGMLDLLEIRSALEAAGASFDVELVVVSNSETKFQQHIQPFAMRTRYVEWSSASLLAELRRAAVVVIPNSLDDFSVSKSSNRAVLLLHNGVPVVSTRTPALQGLGECTILDDFGAGLSTYFSDSLRVVSLIGSSIARSIPLPF